MVESDYYNCNFVDCVVGYIYKRRNLNEKLCELSFVEFLNSPNCISSIPSWICGFKSDHGLVSGGLRVYTTKGN